MTQDTLDSSSKPKTDFVLLPVGLTNIFTTNFKVPLLCF